MIQAWRKMLAVLVSHGKFVRQNDNRITKINPQRSHIKGKASHKIVSDGRLLLYIPLYQYANLSLSQRETYFVT